MIVRCRPLSSFNAADRGLQALAILCTQLICAGSLKRGGKTLLFWCLIVHWYLHEMYRICAATYLSSFQLRLGDDGEADNDAGSPLGRMFISISDLLW